jgi:hypothetical protein
MKAIGTLMQTKVPITYLTATLPIRLEPTLKRMLIMPSEHTVIRANTARPEHQYFVLHSSKDELFQIAVAFIHLISSISLRDERRGIIFVRSKEMGENLRTMFPQMDFIHADIKDDRTRLEMMAKWRCGRTGGWIIGTTSLIQGIDYHDVHLVVFVASPFGLFDLVQGAGRAGRNGAPSKIIVIHCGKPPGPSKDDPQDLSCKREMVKWLTDTRCRRAIISECMDGAIRTCRTLPNAILCDKCEPNHNLRELWGKAKQFDPDTEPGTSLELRLTTIASTLSPLEPPTPLPMIPIRPRIAPPAVIRHSLHQLSLREARVQVALECIVYLEAFAPNCGICSAESQGTETTGIKHKSIKECKAGNHFMKFYDWNKPSRNGLSIWSYDVASMGQWCYACALPQKALKERGLEHEMRACPWSDIMSGVAWSIWHQQDLFERMKEEINCALPCGLGLANKEKVQWSTWLSQQNSRNSAYNIHEVWLWYCKSVIHLTV